MEKFHREEINDFCYLTVLLGQKKLRSMKRVRTLARMGQKERNVFGLKQRFLAGTCEHDNDLQGSVKVGTFLDQISDF